MRVWLAALIAAVIGSEAHSVALSKVSARPYGENADHAGVPCAVASRSRSPIAPQSRSAAPLPSVNIQAPASPCASGWLEWIHGATGLARGAIVSVPFLRERTHAGPPRE